MSHRDVEPFAAVPAPSRLPVQPRITGVAAGADDHRWLWNGPTGAAGGLVPCAVLVDHGDHYMQVPWATYAGAPSEDTLFTLDSLRPLTIVERIACGTCGAQGRIEAGVWTPLEGEVS